MIDNNFIENITNELTEKIKTNSKYKEMFDGIDNIQSNEEILKFFCQKLFSHIGNMHKDRMVENYNFILGENENFDSMKTDYGGRNEVFELLKGDAQKDFKVIAPLLAIIQAPDNMPEELKLIILTDCFNAIGHNMEYIFGIKTGKHFWFELKDKIMMELLKRLGNKSVYIHDTNKNDVIAVLYKIKFNDQVDFFTWHAKKSVWDKSNEFNISDYQNPQLKQELDESRRCVEKKCDIHHLSGIYNHGLYNEIFQQANDYKRDVSEIFSIAARNTETLTYEGGGSYEDPLSIEADSKIEEKDDNKTIIDDFFDKIKSCISKEEIDIVVQNSEISKIITGIEILKLRGRYPTFFAKFNIEEKCIVVKCNQNFKYENKDKCYTKSDIEKIETLTPSELANIIEASENTLEENVDKNIFNSLEEGVGLAEIDKLIKNSDFSQIIDSDNISEDVKKAFELLSYDTQDTNDKLTRSIALVLAIEELKQSKVPLEEYGISDKFEINILEAIIREEKERISVIKEKNFRRYYLQISLSEKDKVVLNWDKFIRDVKTRNPNGELESHIKSAEVINLPLNEINQIKKNDISERFLSGDRTEVKEELPQAKENTFDDENSHETEEQPKEFVKMEDRVPTCLSKSSDRISELNKELTIDEKYEQVLFLTETMLPEEKFKMLEKQLLQMMPEQQFMFLLRMLEKFTPGKNNNSRIENHNVGGNNHDEGGQER